MCGDRDCDSVTVNWVQKDFGDPISKAEIQMEIRQNLFHYTFSVG